MNKLDIVNKILGKVIFVLNHYHWIGKLEMSACKLGSMELGVLMNQLLVCK
jgi:hypothetical protein